LSAANPVRLAAPKISAMPNTSTAADNALRIKYLTPASSECMRDR